jgi:uncharacterized protein (UPF0332 family)
MTEPTPSTYMRKAERALATARLLLTDDPDGACNRAYYAMFDAAHAALYAAGVELRERPIKSHHGLVSVFGQHLVRTNQIEAEHGAALNKVLNLRLLADYQGSPLSSDKAAQAIDLAAAFVAAIKGKFAL